MGKLLQVAPCPVCNYYIEGELHYGGSNRSRLFIYFRYVLAICHSCRQVVSVLIETPAYDLPQVLEAAQREITVLEGRVEQGDPVARRLLSLHRQALEEDAAALDGVETALCTVCGSRDLAIYDHLGGDAGEHFEDGSAWIDCPRCDEGRLWIYAMGSWDEIDNGL